MSTALARFVTFEGGEGAGKSTQIRRLSQALSETGARVVVTREPGGSEGAEAVRALLVEGHADRWDSTSELFLLLAARHDHLERTVRPALAAGAWVLCDRFWDSTRVYQGRVGGLALDAIDELHERWLGAFRPGLTVLLDVPAEVGLARALDGRFESKGFGFHEGVRDGFRALAEAEPERFRVVDAGADVDTVAAAIGAHVDAYRRSREGP